MLVMLAPAVARAQACSDGSAECAGGENGGGERGGWALGAGVFGLVASGVVLGLAGASEGTKHTQVPSLPLGVTATVLFTASVPIVASGGASARRNSGARGVLALRVIGWVLYGLALADATGLIAVGALGKEPPSGMIISTGLLGVASLGSMSADALVSRAQAIERPARAMQRHDRAGSQFALWPTLSPAGAGVAGRF